MQMTDRLPRTRSSGTAKPFLFPEPSAAGMDPTTAMRFPPQDVLHHGIEDASKLKSAKTAKSLVRRWDSLPKLDWVGEILRRPAPPGAYPHMHMIRIGSHLFEADPSRARSPDPSPTHARRPEVVDRTSSALASRELTGRALTGKALATANVHATPPHRHRPPTLRISTYAAAV